MNSLVSNPGMASQCLPDVLSSVKQLLAYDVKTKEQFESDQVKCSIHHRQTFCKGHDSHTIKI